jgi:hypothetical protein
VAGTDRQRAIHRGVDQLAVVARAAHQSLPRGLAEREPEADPWHGARERLVQVLHRLDEVGLSKDQVAALRRVDRNGV